VLKDVPHRQCYIGSTSLMSLPHHLKMRGTKNFCWLSN